MGQDEFRFKYSECQVPVGHAEGCPKGSWTDKPGTQGLCSFNRPSISKQVVALMRALSDSRGGANKRIRRKDKKNSLGAGGLNGCANENENIKHKTGVQHRVYLQPERI